MPGQSEYVDLNTFLEEFFDRETLSEIAQLAKFEIKDRLAGQRSISSDSLKGLVAQAQEYLKTEKQKRLAEQILRALQDPNYQAEEFLNMLVMFTPLYDPKWNSKDRNEAIQKLLFLINNNRIKNPDIAYQVLKLMNRERNIEDYPQKVEVRRALATHPNSTPEDVYNYGISASYQERDLPEELLAMLNDQIAKIDKKIDAELKKDVPNMQSIKSLGMERLVDIATVIKEKVYDQMREGLRPKEEVDQLYELINILKDKYNVDNILKSESRKYVQEYDTRMEFQVAQQSEQLKQQSGEISRMRRELDSENRAQREMKENMDEKDRQIARLQQQIKQLEAQLNTERSKNELMNGQMKLLDDFFKESEARSSGSVLGKGKDLAAQIAQLKQRLGK